MNSIKITLTESEAASHLGCAVSTIQQMARNRRLRGLLLGNDGYRFPIRTFEEDVNRLVDERNPPAPIPDNPVPLHSIVIGPGLVPPIGGAVGYACGGVVKPKGPPRLVPLQEPPEVAAAFGPRSWSACG